MRNAGATTPIITPTRYENASSIAAKRSASSSLLAQARMQGYYVKSFEPVALYRVQEPTRLFPGERDNFLRVDSWRVHVVGGVLYHVSPSHGLL